MKTSVFCPLCKKETVIAYGSSEYSNVIHLFDMRLLQLRNQVKIRSCMKCHNKFYISTIFCEHGKNFHIQPEKRGLCPNCNPKLLDVQLDDKNE